MPPLLILAEGRSLDDLIHFIELVMSLTALPGLLGLSLLVWTRFRPSAARTAFFLGLITALLAGFLVGLIYWNDAISDWYLVPGVSLAVGLLVCASAWRSAFRPPPLP